jgi:pilus assembly protein CpaF
VTLARDVALPPGVHWIGREVDCAVCLESMGVIDRHTRLEMAADGKFGLVDLGSAQGTRVNGERIVTAGPLGPWDIVRIGDIDLRFFLAREPRVDTPHLGAADTVMANEPEWLAAAGRLHQRLIEQLDIRRRDVASMSDEHLRSLAADLLNPLAQEESRSLGGDPGELVHFVLAESLGLGPLETLLADEQVGEIMVNGPANLFIERSGKIERSPQRFSGEPALRGIIDRIVTPLGRRVDDASPMVDARLPDGSRVNVIVHPLAIQGTALTIRRFGRRRLTANDLVTNGSLSEPMLAFLRVCVESRRNILVCGGTGSGKTTLLNVLSSLIPADERVITIEDSAELCFDHANLVTLETRPRNIEGRGEVTIRDLVRNALRMRPDRIVVGECRGGETLDMLQAMNTGHDGSLSTVHANSPRELLSRLEVMVLMSGVELPVSAIREQIAGSIHVIVHQARLSSGRRCITRITEITGIVAGTIQMQDIFRSDSSGGDFSACGHVPQFYEELSRAGVSLDLDLFSSGAPA